MDTFTTLDQLSGLVDFMHQHIHQPEIRIIFDLWWKAFHSGSGSRVNLDQLYAQSNLDISKASVYRYFNIIQKLIAEYFEKELEYELPKVFKDKLQQSMRTYQTRRMAQWILAL